MIIHALLKKLQYFLSLRIFHQSWTEKKHVLVVFTSTETIFADGGLFLYWRLIILWRQWRKSGGPQLRTASGQQFPLAVYLNMPPVQMVPFALAVLTANRQCKCPFVLAVVITNRQYKWWRWILPTASRSIFPLAVGNEDRQCSPCYKYASSSSRQFIVPRSSHESTILGGHFFQETKGEVLILISLEEEALEG